MAQHPADELAVVFERIHAEIVVLETTRRKVPESNIKLAEQNMATRLDSNNV